MDFHEEDNNTIRSSHSQMFFKIGALENFAIFKGKQLCRSIFLIKLQVWRPATLLKRDSTQVFSCEYCEIFKNTFFTEHLQWLHFYYLIASIAPQ